MKKGFSIGPVEIHGAFADTGMFGDIVDGDPAITPALEELGSGVEDALGAEQTLI